MSQSVKQYDVIAIGSGSGVSLVERALAQGLKAALVDRGPLGGTCLNVGCIPTKMLILPADRIMEAREAAKLGVRLEVAEIDFPAIMERMRGMVSGEREEIRRGLQEQEEIDFYDTQAHFVNERTLDVDGQRIRADRVFVAAGARPLIPPIQGLEQAGYLTNESILELREQPDSILMIGGGYISCEFAHFFSAVGTKVTILQRSDRLVPNEEPEISEVLRRRLAERVDIHLNAEAVEVRREGGQAVVVAESTRSGERVEFRAQKLLVATGRRSNADTLRPEATGLETDRRGFIKANLYLETNVPGIWAFGDVLGKMMFTHVANREALIAWHNAFAEPDERAPMDYNSAPHGVFSYPPIASVGLTEQAAGKHYDILVGKAPYQAVARGRAMREEDGFIKLIVNREDRTLLGCHIIGPEATTLIQEVVDVMAAGGDVGSLRSAMHIHPALPELVVAALRDLQAPEG